MLYNQGVILTKIQQLLGHKSVLFTERYLGVRFEETREAILMIDAPLTKALTIAVASGHSRASPEVLQLPSDILVN
jgi:hypothetical protein